MSKISHRWYIWPLFLIAGLVLSGAIDRQTQDALKVRHLLKTIQSTPPRPDGKERSAEITQPEVNAYIAWRLAHEKNTVIDAMTVDLLDNDHVAGKIRFDAARLNLEALLGEALNFDFKGIVTTRNREARLELISVSLNGQPVQPEVLDYVIDLAAAYYGTPVSGLNDWYALPEGINRIAVKKSVAVLYY